MTPQASPRQLADEILNRPKPFGWLLDYDGTLVSMAPRPEDASMREDMRALVLSLAQRADTRVAIITGRALQPLLALTGPLPGVSLAVNGGLRLVQGGTDWVHPDVRATLPALGRVRAALEAFAKHAPAVIVEDKTYTLALHYRACPRLEPELEALVTNTLTPELRLIRGKKVFEIQPRVAWDKGHAATHLLEHWNISTSCLFAGDDVIDEPAIRAVQKRGGLGIRVGGVGDDSMAQWRLSDVGDMKKLLEAVLGS